MREILFRGIPKDDVTRHFFADIWKDDCEGSFVYGSLIISKDRYYICVSALCKINCCINNGMTSMIEVIPETVGQCTGSTDKNGKKICEGDILRYTIDGDVYIYVCFWDDGNCEFGLKNEKRDFGLAYAPHDKEIIGNIHDNPELLKGGEG